jgi:hypothetical protein
LEYPDDAVMRHLSNLIGATDPTFSNSIKSIILDAHLNDAAQRKASDVEIAALLKKVKSQAVALQELLSRLDIGAEGSAYQAGLRLEFALDTQRANGSLDLIPEYIRILENLTAAAELRKSAFGQRRAQREPAEIQRLTDSSSRSRCRLVNGIANGRFTGRATGRGAEPCLRQSVS